jgi:hypothetical protein
MRFRFRVVSWAITSAVEHAVLIGLGAVTAAAVVGVVVVVVGSLVVRGLLPMIDRRVDEEWAKAVAPMSSFPDQESSSAYNQTAVRLETVAAEIGIDLAPSTRPDRPHSTQEAGTAFSEIAEELVDLGRLRPTQPEAEQDHSRYRAWRDHHHPRITEAIAVILTGDPPLWDNDLQRFPEGPDTDLAAHLRLHRVLTVEAWLDAADGDHPAAGRALEASWWLNQGLLASPQLEVHRVAMSALELQTAVLRRIPEPEHHWQDRLRSLNPSEYARRAYLCRSWQLRRRAETMLADSHPFLGPVVQPFARLLATPNHEAMSTAVQTLDGQDIAGFDPTAFAAEQYAKVPRWNDLSRSALPPSWQSWPDSIRSGLVAELTRRVLKVRELYGERGIEALEELQPEQPSRMSGLDWRYQLGDLTVSIGIEPDPFPMRGLFPLRETVLLEFPERDEPETIAPEVPRSEEPETITREITQREEAES